MQAEKERAEAARVRAEQEAARARAEAEKAEARRLQKEKEAAEAARAEAERREAARLEMERLDAERAEAARVKAEAEEMRREAERARAEAEAARAEAARLQEEREEAERQAATERAAAAATAARMEAARLEQIEHERIERLREQDSGAAQADVERVLAEAAQAEALRAETERTERVKGERLEHGEAARSAVVTTGGAPLTPASVAAARSRGSFPTGKVLMAAVVLGLVAGGAFAWNKFGNSAATADSDSGRAVASPTPVQTGTSPKASQTPSKAVPGSARTAGPATPTGADTKAATTPPAPAEPINNALVGCYVVNASGWAPGLNNAAAKLVPEQIALGPIRDVAGAPRRGSVSLMPKDLHDEFEERAWQSSGPTGASITLSGDGGSMTLTFARTDFGSVIFTPEGGTLSRARISLARTSCR